MAKNSIAVWNVAHQCNLKCKFCFGPIISKPQCLTTASAQLIINKLAAEGYKSLVFTGGEPLLRSDIIELIKYAKQKGLYTILHTNGVLVTTDFIQQVAGILDQINLPLDGNDVKTNDAMRTNGHFNKIISLLGQLKNKDIKIIISTVATKKNLKNIPAMINIIPNWISKWRIFQFNSEGKSKKTSSEYEIDNDEFHKLIKRLNAGRREYALQFVGIKDNFYQRYDYYK